MLEQLKLRRVDPSSYREKLEPLLRRLQDSTKDSISHYVLRLAYCRTEDLRRWFLAQEVALLKWRLEHSSLGTASSSSTTQGLISVLPEIKLMTSKELQQELPSSKNATLMSLILASTPNIKMDSKIYQVPFKHALDMVQHRQAYVKAGMVYIPESKLVNLVVARFRTNLSRQLVLLSAVPVTPGLERTRGFLENVSVVHTKQGDFENLQGGTDLNATNVPAHIKNMPLCMAQLQLALQRDKHLKHWGRLQYGLFLKGAGLSLEDAMVYFERMFTNCSKGFSKQYGYNWRHMYAKEGKRNNYPPYSCSKIINGNAPNTNEHHGCPFKHSSVQEVTNLLGRLGVNSLQQKAIISQQQSHNYQLACLEHFKVMHPDAQNHREIEMDNLGNHPNAWFHASVKYHEATSGRTGNNSDKSNASPTTTASSPSTHTDSSPASVAISP